MKRAMLATTALSLLTAGAPGAAAQAQETGEQTEMGDRAEARSSAAEKVSRSDAPIALSGWGYNPLYSMDGVRGEELLYADVYGEAGEEIGEVENVWIQNDRIVAITVETDGFLDIGDTHVVAPWDQVELADETVTVPMTEESVEDYDMWGDDSVVTASMDGIRRADDGDVYAGDSVYRLTDVMDDYALAEGVGRGYIDDVLFSRDGGIEAVVFMGRGGYRAAPYYGPERGYDPYGATYPLRYSAQEIESLEPFDYERMDDGWF